MQFKLSLSAHIPAKVTSKSQWKIVQTAMEPSGIYVNRGGIGALKTERLNFETACYK